IKQRALMEAIVKLLGAAPGEPEAPAPPAGGPAHHGVSTAALRILVAEDNPVNQLVALKLLERQSHSVTLVGTGKGAVELFHRQAFDLVLMDIQMPEMDGLQATAAIRAAEIDRQTRIPIIALTAHAM